LTICGDEADLFEFDGLDIGRVGIEELDFTFERGESFPGFCEVGCHAPRHEADCKDANNDNENVLFHRHLPLLNHGNTA